VKLITFPLRFCRGRLPSKSIGYGGHEGVLHAGARAVRQNQAAPRITACLANARDNDFLGHVDAHMPAGLQSGLLLSHEVSGD
jgi:hypothetical protein